MLSIAIPVTLQNLLFSSFTLIDTLMIGRLGDLPLAAVGMAGKWTWFFGIVLFGFTSGAAVFIAQYFGADDEAGIHRTYGVMTIGTMAAAAVFSLLALLVPERIIGLLSSDPEAIKTASVYLRIIALAYPFQALRRSAGTLLQSTQRVVIPFVGAVCSVVTNIVLNAVLIFGLFGFPALGVAGAAIASVIAAAVDMAVVFIGGYAKKTMLRAPLSAMLDINRDFIRQYVRIGAPAMFNETLWALGNLIYSAIYGHMGTEAYAAITVGRSIEDLTCVAIFGLGASCAVMIGSLIGQKRFEDTKRCAWYHLKLTTILSAVIGLGVVLFRTPIMSLFGVSDVVRADASTVLMIYGFDMVMRNLPYMMVVGIFRAGGDVRFGLKMDIVAMWIYAVPVGLLAAFVLKLPPLWVYFILCLDEFVKMPVVLLHYRTKKWLKNITRSELD